MATGTESLADVEPAAIYTRMRDGILSLAPAEAGIVPSPQCPHVWGVLAELGFDDGCVTLVSLADGTTSLYFSGGGHLLEVLAWSAARPALWAALGLGAAGLVGLAAATLLRRRGSKSTAGD